MNVPPWLLNELGHKFLKKWAFKQKYSLSIVSADFNVLPKSDNFEFSNLVMSHFKGFAQSCNGRGLTKKIFKLWTHFQTLFLPLVLNSFGKALAVKKKYFAVNILIFQGEAWIPQIFSWLLRTAATRAAPRPEPSVDSIRSNLYSTWLSGQTCTQPGYQVKLVLNLAHKQCCNNFKGWTV